MEFQRGNFSVDSAEKTKKSRTSTEENITHLRKILGKDKRVTYYQSDKTLDSNKPAIRLILKDNQHMTKLFFSLDAT